MSRQRAVLSILCAIPALFLLGGAVAGCNSDASVSKSDEEKFKNPPKDGGEKAAEYMKNHPANGASSSSTK